MDRLPDRRQAVLAKPRLPSSVTVEFTNPVFGPDELWLHRLHYDGMDDNRWMKEMGKVKTPSPALVALPPDVRQVLIAIYEEEA